MKDEAKHRTGRSFGKGFFFPGRSVKRKRYPSHGKNLTALSLAFAAKADAAADGGPLAKPPPAAG
jgi:hypothetical protein